MIASVAMGVVVLALVAMRVAPLLTGPALPAGAERLHITTAAPNLNMGCATALLSPVRVSTDGDALSLMVVESGAPIRVVWPAGFGAWRIDGRAVVADPWGSVSAGRATSSTVSAEVTARTRPSISARSAS
jgi:hypothetical protein